MNQYDDMINLPHHVSKNHPQMSLRDRAAQFSPFAALTGHGEKIKETARLTEKEMELDEYEAALLDEKLRYIKKKLPDALQITVVYFKPDPVKKGGEYLTVTGIVKKLNEYTRQMIFQDGTAIDIGQIYDICLIE